MHKLIIEKDLSDMRLDTYLSQIFPDVSRSKLKKLIESEDILLNGKISKASAKLSINDEIYISNLSLKNQNIIAQDILLDIVYEDDDLIVVNKMRNMVVHPASGNYENTLVNALLHHTNGKLSTINGIDRPGIVHRIDKDTSGLLVVAKNDKVHLDLAEQLKNHSIKREYSFICHGIIEQETIIEKSLGRNPKNKLQIAVVEDGKYAYTTIIPIEIFDKFTYAKAILKTGRTHQIRVHLKYISRPIVGDTVYSNYKENIKGQLLHAGTLGFIHPSTKKYMEFHSDEPDIFKKELNKLRKNN